MRPLLVKTTLALAMILGLAVKVEQLSGQQRDFRPRVLMPSDRFRPITEFPLLAAEDAELADHELVLGVVVKGHARAYPINMLTGPSREILNDELGGVPIAATW